MPASLRASLRPSGRRLAACLLAASLAVPAYARDARPCGTIVIPSGLGQTDPTSVTGLNPLIGSSLFNAEISNILYRPLIWIDADHRIDPRLSIASRIDVSDDGLTFHVTIGPWNWSDGQPVGADDVSYGFELIKRLGKTWAGYGQADMPDIVASLTVTGPKAFDVRLTHRVGRQAFILNGLFQLYALPRHAWRGASTDALWRTQTDPAFFKVVDGPYTVEKFALGRYLTLAANLAYSGPKPTVAHIVVDFLEGTDELRALQSGEIDASNIPYPVWDAAIHLPGFRMVRPRPPYAFQYLGPNLQNPAVGFFRDVRVRQAIADAIDDKQIIDLVYHGSAIEVHGPIPPDPPSGLSADARAGRWPVSYDPARARALLDQAGWAPGPDGVRTRDGQRLAFTVLVPSGRDAEALRAQVIQRNLSAVGVRMRIDELTFTQMLPIVYGPKDGWDAFILGWTYPPWPEGYSLFGTGGINNNGGYSNPRMDVLANALNTSDSLDAVHEFGDYAAEQSPVIVLPLPVRVMLARDGISGLNEALTPIGLWAPEFLRLAGPLACHAEVRHAS